MTTILLVDDEKMITGPLARKLRESGYRVLVADNGRIGLETALTENPDVVVLDVLMPEMDGWEVCKALRKSSPVPILMLTALSDEVDRILGLELGADDYLTKPFSSRELLARIRAMLRRVALDQTQPKPAGELTAGPLRIELDTRRAFKNNQELTLRYKEFELLSLLLHHVGQVVTRAELFDEVWGTDWLGDTRTLDVHVRWLREKVEANPSDPQFIQTVRGIGYRLAASE
ncbi:MAG: response regulator transcription factor [Chloroflexi bacterium]|jgi:DNA-binding response OmpR family regulator|nr:response regulator transcription factor [Chloroflexota bacterium]MBK6713236.1 response regulator transcription factor [Chloroflexota bacterium]MBK7176858.1 response regulator transcription factor [Chloroflexota bacterium]MBP6805206.1 response regulator transcription factor [Chloroflexota bacterium]MBP7593965.1 response regulator transcription factor [Chloroflexota bacterium]